MDRAYAILGYSVAHDATFNMQYWYSYSQYRVKANSQVDEIVLWSSPIRRI